MKFTIRELLLVTLSVCLAVGWWRDRQELNQHYRDLRERYDELREDFSAYEVSVSAMRDLVPTGKSPEEVELWHSEFQKVDERYLKSLRE